MDINLEALQERLDRKEAKGSMSALDAYFCEHKGPFCWKKIAEAPWKTLCMDEMQSTARHHETLARLEGQSHVYQHPEAARHFERARRKEPDLYTVILSLRKSVTGLDAGLRRGRVVAHGGRTKVTSVFPSWRKLRGIIRVAENLRNAQPLSNPLWNILLLRLLLLRAHPFQRGNGRAMRALLSYEMNRMKLTGPFYFPLVKVLDANRPAIIESNIKISRAETEVQLIEAVSESMYLSANLMLICAHCLPTSCENPTQGRLE